jgi:uncharacterized lipoprotein YmbA
MRVLALVPLIALLACAGAAPPRTHYLLRAETSERSGRLEAPLWIGLGRVSVAPYLDRANLVVETEAHQVRPARQHLWAEPLDEALRRYLRGEISRALGYDLRAGTGRPGKLDFRVDVDIDELHGTLAGQARLVAAWRVFAEPAGDEIAAYRFARSRSLAQGGYDGLVEAESALLQQLATDIAQSLRTLEAARPAPDTE